MNQTSLTRAVALAVLLPLTASAQISDWCDTAPALQLNRVTPQWLDAGVLLTDGGLGSVLTNDAQLTADGGAAACFSNFSTINNTFSAAPGRDSAWLFTPATTGTYSFRAGVPAPTSNTVLYLTSSCEPVSYAYGAAECLAAVNHSTATNAQEELSCVPLFAGTPVYLWVDEGAATTTGTNLLLEVSSCFPETEPNDGPAEASPLACAITGGIRDAGDADFFALGNLPAGARVFSLVEAAAAGTTNDFDLRVTTATRTLEYDHNNAATFFGEASGLVAGTPLPAEDTFLRVSYAALATRAEPYVLHTKLELGAATPEVEPNNTFAQATSNDSQYFSGFVGDAGDVDFFVVQANEGDVIFAALDAVPDRTDAGTVAANLNFSLMLTDADGGTLLAVDDTNNNNFNFTQSPAGLDAGTPFGPGEALVWRARVSGFHGLRVAKSTTVPSAYMLSVSVGCSNTVPTVTNVTPTTGAVTGGTTVTITGTDFAQNSQVFIGGRRAPRVSFTATELVVTTPGQDLEGPQTLVVTDALGRPAHSELFTYADSAGLPPTVTNVTPTHTPLDGGTNVTITGTIFRDSVEVFIAGTPALNLTRHSTTRLTATTPPGAEGPADVRVLNTDALEGTLTGAVIYDGAPAISSVTPPAGSSLGGTTVTLAGVNFRAGTRVRFGTTEVQVTSIDPSGTSLTVLSPYTLVDGPYDVTATDTWGQQGTLTAGFTVNYAPPVISTVAPVRGFSSGGTTVTVTGTGLRPGAQVNFIVNSVPVAATAINVRDGGASLTAVTAAHTPGLADVQVINNDAQEATRPGSYRFDGPPVVSSITPSTGLTTGGTQVTITGEEFRPDAGVFFGTIGATGIVVAADGLSLTANSPAATLAGPVIVRVRNTDTQQVIVDGGFLYTYPAPTLAAVSPARGYAAGNTLLTLTGTGFLSTPQTSGPPTVTVGGVAATNVTRVSATQVTARTPQGTPGTYDLVLTNGDGQSVTLANSFTYDPSPLFTGVTPDNGPAQGGTRITVTGSNFVSGASVSVGGVPAFAVSVVSSTSLSATTIAQAAGVWPITVTNPDGQSVTSAPVFTVHEAPAVASVSPMAGVKEGGTEVTLTGSGFQSGAQVLFGGLDATNVTVVSSNTITAVTPAHPSGLTTVTVRNPDGQTITVARAYQYVDAPTLLSVDPASGNVAGGEVVHLYGAGFASGATATFGGVSATSVTFLTSGELLVVTPPHEPGAVDVSVNTQGLTLTLTGAYTYSRGQPVVSAVSPLAGPTAGGTQLSIVGTGFLTGATVTLGGQNVTPVTVLSGTLLRVTTPPHAAAVVDVVVTNTDGQSGSLTATFTYADAPPPTDDTLRDGGSGNVGTPPDYKPVPGGVSCGCSSVDGSLAFAALGLLTMLSRRRRNR